MTPDEMIEKLDQLVNGLAGQQAMHDDSWQADAPEHFACRSSRRQEGQ